MLEQKIPVLITESPEYECKELKRLLSRMPEFLVIGSVRTAKQAIHTIHNYNPHLVFVQEKLHDVSGIDFVKMLYRKHMFPMVVFVGSDYSSAYETLDLAPIDYLKFPVNTDSLREMLERLKFKMKKDELKRKMDVYTQSQEIDTKRVFLQKKGIVVLTLKEIVFCKAELTRTIMVLTDGEQVYLKTTLNETVETINSHSFYRISRSYCINRNYLRKIDKKNAKCIMQHQNISWEIPASRTVINRLESLYTIPIH